MEKLNQLNQFLWDNSIIPTELNVMSWTYSHFSKKIFLTCESGSIMKLPSVGELRVGLVQIVNDGHGIQIIFIMEPDHTHHSGIVDVIGFGKIDDAAKYARSKMHVQYIVRSDDRFLVSESDNNKRPDLVVLTVDPMDQGLITHSLNHI